MRLETVDGNAGGERRARRGFRRIALACAVVMFGATSLLALFGADWPPPVGILWLEALLAVLAVIVYVRVEHRLEARSRGQRLRAAAVEGIIAAVASGLLLLVVNSGEPDITPNPLDHLVWITVLGLAGGLAAQLLWRLALWASDGPRRNRLSGRANPNERY